MKLRFTLLFMCLFTTGLFAQEHARKKTKEKPVILNGADAIPIVVKSNKKPRKKSVVPPSQIPKKIPPPKGVKPVKYIVPARTDKAPKDERA